jgi:hypothetical protein
MIVFNFKINKNMNTIISNQISPKEITKDCDSGVEYASFSYYDGISLAKENNWKQTTSLKELENVNTFIVCCGDVMIRVVPSMYSSIERRVL